MSLRWDMRTTGIVATALITDAAFKLFGEPGVGLATVVLTIVMLVFCEIMPKSIAVVNAAVVARLVIPPVSLLSGACVRLRGPREKKEREKKMQLFRSNRQLVGCPRSDNPSSGRAPPTPKASSIYPLALPVGNCRSLT